MLNFKHKAKHQTNHPSDVYKQVLGVLVASCCMSSVYAQTRPDALEVFAAGSLREVLTEIAAQSQAHGGAKVNLTFGASGLLRERIEQGAPAQVFASADTNHPERLARSTDWKKPVVFVRNALCLLTQPEVAIEPAGMLDTLLKPQIRLGTSTPVADPSGDYAWALFRKAETVRPGAFALLDAKALKLTGGADSPKPPAGRGTYAWVMDERQADVFLTYCTNAVASQREVPRLKVFQIPVELQVGAAYGLTVRSGAGESAQKFADYLLSPHAQTIFERFGFGKP
jgi:ABC-type molybdate transport system substrate-binding protein